MGEEQRRTIFKAAKAHYKWKIKVCVNKHAKNPNTVIWLLSGTYATYYGNSFLMIYFAKVSLTYMPTGPCGPSMPGFPEKPWGNTKIYECVVTMCMCASVTVDSLCLLGVLVVLHVLISLLAPVKYIIKWIKFNKVTKKPSFHLKWWNNKPEDQVSHLVLLLQRSLGTPRIGLKTNKHNTWISGFHF